MMSRIAVFLFAFLYLFAGSQMISAGTCSRVHPDSTARPHTDDPAPVQGVAPRQIGNLQCNLDRLAIVAGLGILQKSLKGLSGGK